MKKAILAISLFLAVLADAKGQGHHAPIHTGPAPIHVTPSPHPGPIVVSPKPHVPVEVFHPVAPVVINKPVVVVPKTPVIVNNFRPQPAPVIVQHPVVVAPERSRAIYKNWQTALARPSPGVNFGLRLGPLSLNVRTHFRPLARNWFHERWWGEHVEFARRYPWHYSHFFNRYPYDYWWRPCTWIGLRGWFVAPWGPPILYDYGNNVVFQNGLVYINGVPVANSDEYVSEAYRLANVGTWPADPNIDWMPLGTFALTTSMQDTQPAQVLQLAISKQGFVSGTLFNNTTNQAVAAEGRVDPSTQRLAIRFPERPDMVLETGIYNLTQDQTPVLVHFGVTQTQTWYLIRLQNDDKKF
jgi:hypothetical protein